jgi:acetyl-CoA carboxylase / biotin carboxylase 1
LEFQLYHGGTFLNFLKLFKSGEGVKCPKDLQISDELYNEACVKDEEEALLKAKKVGYPMMIKASAGGGGKGIRKVSNEEELKLGYSQVKTEVPGSPIFLMRLGSNARHLEVQLLADEYGEAIALYSRDCSVQRRHQKIIEEGPISAVDRKIVAEMEQNAVVLAKAVGYKNLGTVEYLYTQGKYYFLELNPRLQVEHPVTEWICDVNIPCCQLQVAMGIPLGKIPQIREFYNLDGYSDKKLDFETMPKKEPNGHVIAVRITAENPEEGFRPTSGSVQELHFRDTTDLWGYFSIRSQSGIHNFSDSQFGHIFAHGKDREDARRKMVVGLSEVSIRGDIRNTVQFISSLIQREDFIKNEITTSYLDELLVSKSHNAKKPDQFLSILCGASHYVFNKSKSNEEQFLKFIQRGQQPPSHLLKVQFSFELIYEDVKYCITGTCSGKNKFTFAMNGSYSETQVIEMRDDGLLVLFDGESHITYSNETPDGLRLLIDGHGCLFTKEFDPSTLRSNTSGKIVRYLVEDGSRIKSKQPIMELEMMKMIVTLHAPLSGIIKFQMVAGSAIKPGDILAHLDLDDPSQVKRAETFEGKFPEKKSKLFLKPHQMLQQSIQEVKTLLAGYDYPDNLYEKKIKESVNSLKKILEKDVLIAEFLEKLAPFLVQVPSLISSQVQEILYSNKFDNVADMINLGLVKLFDEHLKTLSETKKQEFLAFRASIKDIFSIYEGGAKKYVMDLLSSFAELYLSAEKYYTSNKQEESIYLTLRDEFKGDLLKAFEVTLSHERLQKRNKIMIEILNEVESFSLVDDFMSYLDQFSNLTQKSYSSLALISKHMIMRSRMPSFQRMRSQMEEIFKNAISDEKNRNSILKEVIDKTNFGPDILMTFFSHEDPKIREIANEVYVRKSYLPFENKLFKYSETDKYKSMIWKFIQTRDSVQGETNLKDGIVGSASTDNISELGNETEDYTGFGVMVGFEQLQDLQIYLPNALKLFESSENDNDSINILNLVIKWRETDVPDDDWFIKTFSQIFETYIKIIQPYDIRRITVVVDFKEKLPFYYTFRQRSGYKEDPIYRHIEPTLAFQLLLRKMSNYNITPFSISNPSVHIYYATAKQTDSSRNAVLDNRFFVRTLILKGDIFSQENPDEAKIAELERLLIDSLNGLALAMSDSKFKQTYANHIYIHVIPVLTYKPDGIQEIFDRLQVDHAERLKELRVSQIEAKCKIRTSEKEKPMNLRFVMTNTTGYKLLAEFYQETVNPVTGKSIYSALISQQSPLHGTDLNAPHPLLSQAEVKREIAHNYETSYVYDYPALFELTLKYIWKVYAKSNNLNVKSILPKDLVNAVELSLNDQGNLEPVEYSHIGKNKYGIIVWKITLKTPEYPKGRDIIVIANDITYQSGSFGVLEDKIFFKASELARKEKIPRVFVNANSGARIGLAKEIQKAFKIAWVNPEDPSKGQKYLYLSEKDHSRLSKSVNAELIEDQGEKRWKIIDIIGEEDGIGVENLKGSGLIAGETSRAYKEIFTINYVASRTVGIGAYLVRLGHRVIQHKNVPILLTGASALNKVLGSDVYTSNRQIGGIQIMHNNGVTHTVVPDDFKGIVSILRWLSFVPDKAGNESPIIAPCDPIDREVEFMPEKDQPYDPRFLLAGVQTSSKWMSGFFDKDSFIETLSGWAKNVVVGRARLGGIPMGVIAVETRTMETVIPADPADATSQEQIIQKAGQVWYPDSAYKTSQAIKDFNNGENLPLIIFANWRGFSGGQRDMFNEILKFGSYIVDELREYKQPVFVYLAPRGELRGGAWVVVDPSINPEMMEMYADKTSTAGILEPNGTVEIKFRKDELINTIKRLDDVHINLSTKLSESTDEKEKTEIKKQILAREHKLLPIYQNIAEQFVVLQDTPGRMKAKDTITDVLDWKTSRAFFYWRLRRKLIEHSIVKTISNEKLSFFDKLKLVRQWIEESSSKDVLTDDKALCEWFGLNEGILHKKVKELSKKEIEEKVGEFLTKDYDSTVNGLLKYLEGKEDLLKLLKEKL